MITQLMFAVMWWVGIVSVVASALFVLAFLVVWAYDSVIDRIAGQDRRERISGFLVWESAEPISEVDEFIAEVLGTTQARSSS